MFSHQLDYPSLETVCSGSDFFSFEQQQSIMPHSLTYTSIDSPPDDPQTATADLSRTDAVSDL